MFVFGGNSMKFKVLIFALFAGALLLSGCTQPLSEEDQAIALASESAFGKVILWYEALLARGKNCSFEDFTAMLGESGAEFDEAAMKPHFDSAAGCIPVLEKKAEKAGGKYNVSYAFKAPDSCKDERLVEQMNQTNPLGPLFADPVVVDLQAGSVEMPDFPSQGAASEIDSWEKFHNQLDEGMFFGQEMTEKQLDCAMVGSMAMYTYFQDQLQEQIVATQVAETG